MRHPSRDVHVRAQGEVRSVLLERTHRNDQPWIARDGVADLRPGEFVQRP
jgi:hypothetical protein